MSLHLALSHGAALRVTQGRRRVQQEALDAYSRDGVFLSRILLIPTEEFVRLELFDSDTHAIQIAPKIGFDEDDYV